MFNPVIDFARVNSSVNGRWDPVVKSGWAAILRALKKANCEQAHDGKQVKIRGKSERLWIIADSDETKRLQSVEPGELAEEYERTGPFIPQMADV